MAAEQSFITPDQYLEIERKAESKSEYISGQMFARQGASRIHANIVTNIVIGIHTRLLGRKCKAVTNDLRVQIDPAGPYFYPDIVVYCDDAIWIDKYADTLTNPHIVFEVLSPSTEQYDRGEKFFHYRRVAQLTDIVFVAQSRVCIEHYHREGESWRLTDIVDLKGMLKFTSLGIELPVNEIYSDIEFPPVLVVKEPEAIYSNVT